MKLYLASPVASVVLNEEQPRTAYYFQVSDKPTENGDCHMLLESNFYMVKESNVDVPMLLSAKRGDFICEV